MKRIFALAVLGGALVMASPAQAHGFFSFHFGVPGISVNLSVPPVCVRPAPVYVAPAPVCVRPAVVVRPAPVVVVPRRVVVARPVVVHPRPRVVVAAPYPY